MTQLEVYCLITWLCQYLMIAVLCVTLILWIFRIVDLHLCVWGVAEWLNKLNLAVGGDGGMMGNHFVFFLCVCSILVLCWHWKLVGQSDHMKLVQCVCVWGKLKMNCEDMCVSVCPFGCSVWGMSLENVFAIFPASSLSSECVCLLLQVWGCVEAISGPEPSAQWQRWPWVHLEKDNSWAWPSEMWPCQGHWRAWWAWTQATWTARQSARPVPCGGRKCLPREPGGQCEQESEREGNLFTSWGSHAACLHSLCWASTFWVTGFLLFDFPHGVAMATPRVTHSCRFLHFDLPSVLVNCCLTGSPDCSPFFFKLICSVITVLLEEAPEVFYCHVWVSWN